MRLYHYGLKKSILTEGINSYIKHPDTSIINNLIIEVFGECFNRDICVFFNLERRDEGIVTVSVDSNDLNQELINVADQDLADSIYSEWYRGKDCTDLIRKYVSSIKKLKDYNGEYKNPEIFYEDDIPANLLTLEFIE